jgi:hypothetical protein
MRLRVSFAFLNVNQKQNGYANSASGLGWSFFENEERSFLVESDVTFHLVTRYRDEAICLQGLSD